MTTFYSSYSSPIVSPMYVPQTSTLLPNQSISTYTDDATPAFWPGSFLRAMNLQTYLNDCTSNHKLLVEQYFEQHFSSRIVQWSGIVFKNLSPTEVLFLPNPPDSPLSLSYVKLVIPEDKQNLPYFQFSPKQRCSILGAIKSCATSNDDYTVIHLLEKNPHNQPCLDLTFANFDMHCGKRVFGLPDTFFTTFWKERTITLHGVLLSESTHNEDGREYIKVFFMPRDVTMTSDSVALLIPRDDSRLLKIYSSLPVNTPQIILAEVHSRGNPHFMIVRHISRTPEQIRESEAKAAEEERIRRDVEAEKREIEERQRLEFERRKQEEQRKLAQEASRREQEMELRRLELERMNNEERRREDERKEEERRREEERKEEERRREQELRQQREEEERLRKEEEERLRKEEEERLRKEEEERLRKEEEERLRKEEEERLRKEEEERLRKEEEERLRKEEEERLRKEEEERLRKDELEEQLRREEEERIVEEERMRAEEEERRREEERIKRQETGREGEIEKNEQTNEDSVQPCPYYPPQNETELQNNGCAERVMKAGLGEIFPLGIPKLEFNIDTEKLIYRHNSD
ncbi:putative signal recognition particle-docking protein FtsY [Blattamonas nauphoetae]|uniref:Signal recognition particle-docking protein FtsY n=1 Tax=Blattamonas nauphoetae TaxID=2049346 RepID=A0ABQ9XGI2_9EUKA|nr:putative signal recognition particle-docking protein FtsY [Blattamonas nauphoetae]